MNKPVLSLSKDAQVKIASMMEANGKSVGIRLMIVGGGCSGLSYDMDFEDEARGGDVEVEFDGFKVFIDPMSLEYVEGTAIDYVETFSYAGFSFNNPNASKNCGCGSSFTV